MLISVMVLYCGKSLAPYSARCCKVDVPVLWQMFFIFFLKKMFLIIFLFFEFIFKLFFYFLNLFLNYFFIF